MNEQAKVQRRVVLIQVEADDPSEAVEAIRRFADRIEKGETFEDAGSREKAAVRSFDDNYCGEVAFVGRYFGVGYDGEEVKPPVALFASSTDAEAYAAGGVWDDEEDMPSAYGIIVRCDVFGSLWGSFDNDPVDDDQTAAR